MRAMFGLLGAALLASSASAVTITTFSTRAGFNAATTVTNTATFESFAPGVHGQSAIDDGISFVSLSGGGSTHDVYFANPSVPLTNSVPTTSVVLTADGDENFSISRTAGGTFDAIGFDFTSNSFGNHVVKLYGLGNVLLGSIAIDTPVSSTAFFGLMSDTPILYADTQVYRGFVQDTGFDNVTLGNAPSSAAPEPATWAMMVGGFGLAGVAMRRRKMATSFA